VHEQHEALLDQYPVFLKGESDGRSDSYIEYAKLRVKADGKDGSKPRENDDLRGKDAIALEENGNKARGVVQKKNKKVEERGEGRVHRVQNLRNHGPQGP
jgi:hypothetical protein